MEFGIFASSNSAPSNPTKRNRSSRAQSGKSVASKDYLRQDENINESNGQESTNNNYGGTILISIVENRAREICIAKINTESVCLKFLVSFVSSMFVTNIYFHNSFFF